jgi:uncharacterized SAM-binding protein YcdF (DUF218 family)
MSNHKKPKKTAAVVLGGGLKKIKFHGQIWYEPEAQAKERLDKGYDLFEAGIVDYIITTGKYSVAVSIDPSVNGPKTEAEVGKRYLIAKSRARANDAATETHNIEACIVYEDQSVDTIGNAWFTKKLCLEPLGITSCIVVTSDYHIERSRVIFEWILGPQYTVACAEAPSHLNAEERKRRDHFEKTLTDYMKTHLISTITAGDDESIQQFMENEHQRLLSGANPPPPIPHIP